MQKKKRKTIRPSQEQVANNRAQKVTVVVIVLFALLGLILGYVMFQEFSGKEQLDKGKIEKNENEN